MFTLAATSVLGIPVVTLLFLITLIIFVLDIIFGFALGARYLYSSRVWSLCWALWSLAFILWHQNQ